MVKINYTTAVISFIVVGIAATIMIFQWINGTTPEARQAGQIFSTMILIGLGFVAVYLGADKFIPKL